MANNKSEKASIEFESGLDDKEQFLGEEIRILSVGDSKPGTLGGSFRVAEVEYGEKKLNVAFGTVLSKQWDEWTAKAGDKALPATAVIEKNRGKRYYSFASIEET